MGRRRLAGLVAMLCASACGLDVVGSAIVASEPSPTEDGGGPLLDASPSADAGSTEDASPDAPADATPDALVDAGPEPPTILSPFSSTGELTYQRAIDWTIAALDGTVPIRWTTNGESPLLALANVAVGKVTIASVGNNTTIKWSAGTSTVVHSFLVKVDANLSSSTHTIVDRVTLGSATSPFVKVQPGQTIVGHARYFMWNAPSGCPTCIDQILVGVSQSEDCIASANPDTYPGDTDTSAEFTITAPSAPGIYKVKTGFRQEYNCSPDAINKPLGTTEIGTLVVE